MKKIKQGQTRWVTVLYKPGRLKGYDNCHVAAVYACQVTAVKGKTVYFTSGEYPYMCNAKGWGANHKTYRKAWTEAQKLIRECN